MYTVGTWYRYLSIQGHQSDRQLCTEVMCVGLSYMVLSTYLYHVLYVCGTLYKREI
jgi:hypothetical protein